jgi:hypothetical protein
MILYPTRTYNKNKIPFMIIYGARVKFKKLKIMLLTNATIKNKPETILKFPVPPRTSKPTARIPDNVMKQKIPLPMVISQRYTSPRFAV